MSLLFDVSEPGGEKPARARRGGTPHEPEKETQKTPYLYREIVDVLGTIDDVYQCSRCQAFAQDILTDDNREWLIACAFCGAMQWVKEIKGHLKPKPEEFRFRDGLFAGKTPAEAALERRGREYLEWASASHPRPSVRQAVKTYLDSLAAGR